MKKFYIYIMLIINILFVEICFGASQPPNPGGDPSAGGNSLGGGAPLGEGHYLLISFAILYIGYKWLQILKERKEELEA